MCECVCVCMCVCVCVCVCACMCVEMFVWIKANTQEMDVNFSKIPVQIILCSTATHHRALHVQLSSCPST